MWPDLTFPPINLYSVPRAGPLSPCVKLCQLDGGKCTGCDRTIDEIRRWSEFTDEERLALPVFSYGAGRCLDTADKALKIEKAARVQSGERADRCQVPP